MERLIGPQKLVGTRPHRFEVAQVEAEELDRAGPARATISSIIGWLFCSERPVTNTRPPRPAKASAVSRPMPVFAPVTTKVLWSRSPICAAYAPVARVPVAPELANLKAAVALEQGAISRVVEHVFPPASKVAPALLDRSVCALSLQFFGG